MKTVLSEIRPAIVSTLVFAVVCCGFYPLAVTGISKVAFADKAERQPHHRQEWHGHRLRPARSELQRRALFPPASVRGGCEWLRRRQFQRQQPRPHLAEAARIPSRSASPPTAATTDSRENQPVPADAVTASGSGLDPHISPANAALQAARVAKARSLAPEKVKELIAAEHRQGGSSDCSARMA